MSSPQTPPDVDAFVDADSLRTRFALAMSSMYKSEVSLYSDLIKIVRDVNQQALRKTQKETGAIHASGERLTLERHGAIRLGTPYELQQVKRIFALLGMHPVGYYDLSVAGIPMHATCFRPVDMASLTRSPFRVFTTLLRPELLKSDKTRALAAELLAARRIFSARLVELLRAAEDQGGKLTAAQSEAFIPEALRTFGWQPVAAVSLEQYNQLKAEHPILADVASFQSAHVNHLTPRTLDIDATQRAMQAAGIAVKSFIEGPPRRKCPILLRQTSFLALEEPVKFLLDGGQVLVQGRHKARFGEIEERGAAVTEKGRELYDTLLGETRAQTAGREGAVGIDLIAAEIFKRYPDDWNVMRRQGLVYCEFRCKTVPVLSPTRRSVHGPDTLLEQLISDCIVEASPITYEDFLPFSAAGIFQSNLSAQGNTTGAEQRPAAADREGLETAMDGPILDAEEWYAGIQRQSLECVASDLGLDYFDLVQIS
ncbi:hypothetical protein BDW74DRAFT_166700 [Aspergillus multicolor]|uniref:uncharacterized protein n=1 Tax=Aspergillus multicolor TaxID=41759 RepID=UPI003CCCEA8C